MRGSRYPRKVISAACGTPYRCVVSSDLHNSQRSVWVVSDDGHPKSPLSIERMPRNVVRKISRVARVKPTCKSMARKRKAPPEGSHPFFIDKSPSDELVDVMRNRGRSFMNESVIILDSPSPASELTLEWPAQGPRAQDSVDTVDLCSEEEEELAAATKGTKRKKRREVISGKRRKLCIKAQGGHQPDIIVLDDEDDCTGRSNPNTSIIVESMQVKTLHNSRCIDNSPATSSVSGPSEIPRVTIARNDPSTGQSTSVWSKCLDKDQIIKVYQDKDTFSGNGNPGPTGNVHPESNSTKPNLLDTVGSNVFNPCGNVQQTGLRPIIIDGCNVAIAHGGNRMFSVRGLCICVEYFIRRGHSQVVALVPLHQRSKVSPQDRDVLESLKNDSHLVFTPSRFIENRLISSYDDRYIVQYAAAVGGVIVSRDNYRDLLAENPAWRDTITNRLLMPTWVGDILMFPVDPLGKSGPSLDDFLRFPNK